MKNELDIVDQLLGNDGIADCHKPRTKKKKAIRDGIIDKDMPPDDYEPSLEPHVKHLDPAVKGRDAAEQNKNKPHWIGDCHRLSKAEKESAGLPDDAYLYIFRVQGPNGSCCVYDPVHWIYGWGEDTMDAAKDCLKNIRDYRAEFPDKIPDIVKAFEDRIAKHGNPFAVSQETVNASRAYQSKSIQSKTTTDILKDIGL